MEVTTEVNVETSVKEKLLHLSPELKLLYDTLRICLDSIENKIEPNVATRVDSVEMKQKKTEAWLTKLKWKMRS